MTSNLIYTTEDILAMLDRLLAPRGGPWWDGFFADRSKPCPFFVEWPDENLVEYFESTEIKPGRVLELGCGHGRNAVFLASRGCRVDAVDFSAEAISWARERAQAASVTVNFLCCSIFDLRIEAGSYDMVYDCGCFHHLPPHRRKDYVDLLTAALKPSGAFGLVCFAPEAGSGLTDQEVYEQRTLAGGLGYTEASLRAIFSRHFQIASLRRMREVPPDCQVFGKDFLWTALMRRTACGT